MSDTNQSDYSSRKQAVLGHLIEVAGLADQSGATTLAEKLKGDRIPRLQQERFHLVVLGEFNHGKTTFVNALLGSPVLPMGVTPTTAVIHHVIHGETTQAKAVLEDGAQREVAVDELSGYVVEGKASREQVRYVEVTYPSGLFEEGVVLVDTPGVNDLNLARAEITYSYVPKADAVLFLLDAGQILKESERSFLQNKLLSQSRDKVLFIINKIDLLDEEEKEEALAYARSHLSRLLKDPKVYAVSAEQALEGDLIGSGMKDLVADLRLFLTEERGRVLLDNALDEGLRAVATLKSGVEVQRRVLKMDQAELERRLLALEKDLSNTENQAQKREIKIRESLAGVKAKMRQEIESFGERFAQALPAEIESSKTEDLKRYLPAFMEERFRAFADEQGEVLGKDLERVAEEAIAFLAEDASEQSKRLREMLGESAPSVDLSTDTFAYDVGVIALGAFGIGVMALSNIFVGGALTLAAPILAYVFRERADAEVKKRAMEEAPRAVKQAAQKLAEAFEAQIDEFGDKLVEFVSGANEELTRSIAEVVRAAREAKSHGEVEIGQLESTTAASLTKLKALQKAMDVARRALWSNGTGESAAEPKAAEPKAAEPKAAEAQEAQPAASTEAASDSAAQEAEAPAADDSASEGGDGAEGSEGSEGSEGTEGNSDVASPGEDPSPEGGSTE